MPYALDLTKLLVLLTVPNCWWLLDTGGGIKQKLLG